MEHNIVLLLTGCINPSLTKNKYCTLKDAELRLSQYVEAIDYYLSISEVPCVFVENSGYESSDGFINKRLKESNRLEILSYLADEEVRSRGKGYGEQDIIRYAFDNSRLIKDAEYIVKITGRLKIQNIKSLINITKLLANRKEKYFIGVKLYKAEWMHSYLFIGHKDFFNDSFFNQMKRYQRIMVKKSRLKKLCFVQ